MLGETSESGGVESGASAEQSWLQYLLGDETKKSTPLGGHAPPLVALKIDDTDLNKPTQAAAAAVPIPAAVPTTPMSQPVAGVAADGPLTPVTPVKMKMSTVLAVDGGWGNGDRLKVALSKVLPLILEAKSNCNVTTLVVMGNVAGSGDAAALATSADVVRLSTHHVLLASSFDLACLRLQDRGIDGELVSPPLHHEYSKITTAFVALKAPAPLEATSSESLPDLWTIHNYECVAAFTPLEQLGRKFATTQETADAVAVALLLKMASMMDRMLNVGGINGMLAQSIDRLHANSLQSLKQQLGSMVNMVSVYSEFVDLISPTPKITAAGNLISKDAHRVVTDIVNWATGGGFHKYMLSAKLVAFVPWHDDEADDSLNGTWLASSGMCHESIVGKLLVDGTVSGKRFFVESSKALLSPRDWERELDRQFTQFYLNFHENRVDKKLWTAIVALGAEAHSFGEVELPMPISFGPRAVGIFGARSAPFAITCRTVRWTKDDYPITGARWVRLARGQMSWGIISHCTRTARAMSPHPDLLERNVPFNELQLDVSIALASLLEFKDNLALDRLQSTPFKNGVQNLKGILGPCVKMGVAGQAHRVVWWKSRGVQGGVIMMLPELYVRLAFTDYLVGSGQHTEGARAVCCGYLSLDTRDVVPLNVKGIHVEELEPRVFWIRGSTHWSELTTGETIGAELGDSSQYKLYYYSSTSMDGLSGLRVRVTFAKGDHSAPTLDADLTAESGLQFPFEYFSDS